MPPRTNARSKTTANKSAASKKTYDKKTIALVYDFDGTLSPRPMQEYAFLPKIGVEPKGFWRDSNRLAMESGADPLITYMRLLYQKAKKENVQIDRKALVAQGKKVEFFDGVESWFGNIKKYIKSHPENHGVTLRHYLISSGLQEIVEGTKIYKHFHNVFASEYSFEAYDMPFPKRVITDTGKTQYLFRINKGVEDLSQSINDHLDESLRPIPFSNMIYFGDGDTDVPSMAVTRKNGGHAIAVYPPGKSRKKCFDLFKAGRVDFFAAADYRKDSDLYNRTTLLLDRILADIRVREEMWRISRQAAH